MNLLKTSSSLILGTLTLFWIPSVDAGGCSSHKEKMAEIKCLSDDKKCIDSKEKELLFEVEA